MGSTTTWIILGALIGVVVIFLVITTVLDKKKQKKIKEEQAILREKISKAGTNVSKKVILVFKENDKFLEKFVPSIGKYKMSDINKKAKESLSDIKRSSEFILIKHIEDEYVKFEKNINNLISTKSNNWKKYCAESIEFFKTYKSSLIKDEDKETNKKKKGKK